MATQTPTMLKAIRDLVGPLGADRRCARLARRYDARPFWPLRPLFSVLRTAPHRDDRETGCRAADQLIRVLTERESRRGRPPSALPILVPGEAAVTHRRPRRTFSMAGCREWDARPEIMEANILVGFAWNDRPWSGMTALVTAEGDAGACPRGGHRARNADLGTAPGLPAQYGNGRNRRGSPPRTNEPGKTGLRQQLRRQYDRRSAWRPHDRAAAGNRSRSRGYRRRRDHGAGNRSPVHRRRRRRHRSKSCSAPSTSRGRRPREQFAAMVLACWGNASARRLSALPDARKRPWAAVKIGNARRHFPRPVRSVSPRRITSRRWVSHPTAHQAYVVKLGYLHPQLEDIAGRSIVLAQRRDHAARHEAFCVELTETANLPTGHGHGLATGKRSLRGFRNCFLTHSLYLAGSDRGTQR